MNQAQTLAWVSDIAIGAGLIGIGVSAILFLTSKPHPQQTGARRGPMIQPLIGPTSAGVFGRF